MQCKPNVDKYLQYELLITVSEETVSAKDFSAITVCPMTPHRKPMIGKLDSYLLSVFYSYSRNEVEMEALYTEVR